MHGENMKYKVTPNSNEKVMREDDFIVSKTDLQGIITYGNRIFIEFSGYSEAELLGSQHNIIRWLAFAVFPVVDSHATDAQGIGKLLHGQALFDASLDCEFFYGCVHHERIVHHKLPFVNRRLQSHGYQF